MTTPLLVTARAATWLVVALIAVALLAAPGGPLGAGLAQADDALVLTGDAEGLDPGGTGVLRVTVASDAAAAVRVSTVTASVTGGGEGCDGSALTVTPWTGDLVVPAHGAATVELAVTMADRAACAGQAWQLRYAAS